MRAAGCMSLLVSTHGTQVSVAKQFEAFVSRHGRKYSTDKELEYRFQVFTQNLETILEVNSKKLNYTLGVNQFTDRTAQELRGGLNESIEIEFNLTRHETYLGTLSVNRSQVLATDVNWTDVGFVTPVQNQQQCNSCWAFATTQALESAWAISTGSLLQLSPQQLVDCDDDEMACAGAFPGVQFRVYDWMRERGVCNAESFPYKGYQGWCQDCTAGIRRNAIQGFMVVEHGQDMAMMQALSLQPVSMVLHSPPLHPYESGIFDGDCTGIPDHAVLMTGYGMDRGLAYWLIKNSWGVSWGEHGYIRLARGIAGDGQCSSLMRGSFPIVDPAAATGPTLLPGKPVPAPAGPLPDNSYYGRPPCVKSGEVEIRYPAGSKLFPQGAAVCGAPYNFPHCPVPAVGSNKSAFWLDLDFNFHCVQGCHIDTQCPDGASCYLPPPEASNDTGAATGSFCVWSEQMLI